MSEALGSVPSVRKERQYGKEEGGGKQERKKEGTKNFPQTRLPWEGGRTGNLWLNSQSLAWAPALVMWLPRPQGWRWYSQTAPIRFSQLRLTQPNKQQQFKQLIRLSHHSGSWHTGNTQLIFINNYPEAQKRGDCLNLMDHSRSPSSSRGAARLPTTAISSKRICPQPRGISLVQAILPRTKNGLCLRCVVNADCKGFLNQLAENFLSSFPQPAREGAESVPDCGAWNEITTHKCLKSTPQWPIYLLQEQSRITSTSV